MSGKSKYKFWFCPGSVDLYGDEEIRIVTEHCTEIVNRLNHSKHIPFEIELKPTLLSGDVIYHIFEEANHDSECAGIIAWMHMFSPAKSWIRGLKALRKPLLHFHTQYNIEIPYDTIDMDFININQSAHGDREFAYMLARMQKEHQIVVGHWSIPETQSKLGQWMRTAVGIVESENIKVLRLADNMVNVADTEGDKVEAQLKLGWQVDTYTLGLAEKAVYSVSDKEAADRVEEYEELYRFNLEGRDPREFHSHVMEQARMEIGLEWLLKEKKYQAIVTHFDDLGTLKQLPGLAIQRLMNKGYGFAAEGDWKTAGLLRIVKLMTENIENKKGSSFMEDYTYNLVPGEEGVLETHMLEVCPSIADGDISVRVKPLILGHREDPARLVFTAKEGEGIAASMVDMGDRLRLVINDIVCRKTKKQIPNLPVASAFWTPKPDFLTGVEAWLMTGGAHHTVMTYDLTAKQLGDWGEALGLEVIYINEDTNIYNLKKELRRR